MPLSTSHRPQLPPLATLERLANVLLERVGAGDLVALDQVRALHPRGADALRGFAQSDARLVIARAHDAPSWPRLKRDLTVYDEYAWDPPEDPAACPPESPPGDALLRLACLTYGNWNHAHAAAARALLAAEPALASANIYLASAVGDVPTVRRLVEARPSLATTRGGPYRWEPLLYACYSRLDSDDPARDTLEVARVLLAAGADANAGFLWKGNSPPFTALTGALGGGEAGLDRPPHRHALALARLLLESGADPNDAQALHNRRSGTDDTHLALLFSFGLGTDKGGPWFGRLGDRLPSPAAVVAEELALATRAGDEDRVRRIAALHARALAAAALAPGPTS